MADDIDNINTKYERFYADRPRRRVYPTEFGVRTFLANYTGLKFDKPAAGNRVLDVDFSDGRDTVFLCEQGFDVSGIEITQGIVEQTTERLKQLGYGADLRVGRNCSIPFEDGFFDYILACHCCYYCDDGEAMKDNLRRYARVLKPGGYLIASVAHRDSYVFRDAVEQADGSMMIAADSYNNRNGYRLHGFFSASDIEKYFSESFIEFSFGFANNDYYGIHEQVFWVICQKR